MPPQENRAIVKPGVPSEPTMTHPRAPGAVAERG